MSESYYVLITMYYYVLIITKTFKKFDQFGGNHNTNNQIEISYHIITVTV